MKIGIIVPYLYDGGAERVASIWCNILSEFLKYDTTLITFYPKATEYYLSKLCKRCNLFEDEKEYKNSGFLSVRTKIKQYLHDNAFDIIIPFLNLPLVFLSTIKTSASIVPTIRNNPWITPKGRLYRIFRDYCIYKHGRVIVQNEEQGRYFNNKITKYIISNPLNEESIKIKKTTDVNKLEKFIMVGRLHEQKNYDMALRVAQNLKNHNYNFSLDIYGDGPEKDNITLKIHEMGLDNYVFLKGNCSNVIELETQYDAFIMTSNYEGFPNALMEALTIGMFAISTNCKTGPSDLIFPGKTGFLVDVNDSESMAMKIIEMNNKISVVNSIRRSARDYMLKEFSLEKEIESLRFMCQQVTREK